MYTIDEVLALFFVVIKVDSLVLTIFNEGAYLTFK